MRLIRFLLKRIHRIVVTNNFIANEFLKKGFDKNKILVAPNGIDLAVFDITETREAALEALGLAALHDKKLLLYTGSFKTAGLEKGIADILAALKKLNDRNIVFLAVGGNEEDIIYYVKLAQDAGVADQALFHPRQTQERLALFQKAADILLMPFPKIERYEYFMTPLKMFEYMAGKRPIIASDLPSIREILDGGNCLFCRPDNPEDLAEKIKQVLRDPVLSRKLSEQAHMDVGQYGWDRRARRILKFII